MDYFKIHLLHKAEVHILCDHAYVCLNVINLYEYSYKHNLLISLSNYIYNYNTIESIYIKN